MVDDWYYRGGGADKRRHVLWRSHQLTSKERADQQPGQAAPLQKADDRMCFTGDLPWRHKEEVAEFARGCNCAACFDAQIMKQSKEERGAPSSRWPTLEKW